jgi:hypothetical protein
VSFAQLWCCPWSLPFCSWPQVVGSECRRKIFQSCGFPTRPRPPKRRNVIRFRLPWLIRDTPVASLRSFTAREISHASLANMGRGSNGAGTPPFDYPRAAPVIFVLPVGAGAVRNSMSRVGFGHESACGFRRRHCLFVRDGELYVQPALGSNERERQHRQDTLCDGPWARIVPVRLSFRSGSTCGPPDFFAFTRP